MATEVPAWLKVGERVLVKEKGFEGTARFVGTTDFAPGYWIGVELPHAGGKNDGSVKGKSYFACPESHGLFVRPHQLDAVLPEDVPSWLRVGVSVRVRDKDLEGHVRFIGSTLFAPGTWVGVELPNAAGKNNGTVKGKAYFSCPDDHGLFVRPPQLEPTKGMGSSTVPSTPGSGIPLPRTSSGKGKKPPFGGKSPEERRIPGPKQSPTPARDRPIQPAVSVEEPKPPSFAPPSSTTGSSSSSSSAEVIDLQQKLSILQQKRAEDKARLKELEKYRIQYQQMVEYRNKWTESQNELQQQLKALRKEAREAVLQKESAEEELRELSDAVEMATLDKEMAEEKCEAMAAESEALKDQIQELTIDLEIIKNEISESGYEGAAANSQLKQLEHQNARLKDALVRLRDLSNQEKLENQRLVKDFDKQVSSLAAMKELKDRFEEELKEADSLIDELKEQVDVAMGAEEMVENLTDKNLQLEEELGQLTETVNDLEDLRDLSEQQEELRAEVEHELREEADLNLNTIRQLERRLDASQESIVDQQQTIEKYRELVRHLQADITELRQRPQDEGDNKVSLLGPDTAGARPDSMLTQLKTTTVKTYSRTIDFELRKMEAQQAAEMVNVLKAFMPNTFLVSGGDYDALSVIMLLPRLVFKADLIVDQLKQQTSIEEALGSLSKVKVGPRTDLLTFGCFLIYKLTTLQLMVNKVFRVLRECDVQLYRQMGSLRDDLAIHERSLDILIELLKKEELDESVPLNGVEKAIHHLELLLQTRLTHLSKFGQNDLLLDQVKVMVAGCDFCSLELLRLRSHAPDVCSFRTQLKELESFNSDVRHACRKIRRRIPSIASGKVVMAPPELMEVPLNKHLLLVTCFRALYAKVSQKATGLSDGEKLTNGELETATQEVTRVVLLELMAAGDAKPEELPHVLLSMMVKGLDDFLNNLQDGTYDSALPKIKPSLPMMVRAMTVKSELSDTEGLKFKLEEKCNEILEFKKAIKLKAQEVGECNMKIGLLEKKLETVDAECVRKIEEEKQETERVQGIVEQQERKFTKAMEVLQGDIEAVENERDTLKRQLETQSHVAIPPDISGVRRSASLSGRQSLVALLSRGSPLRRGAHDSTPSTTNTSSPAPVQEEPEPSPLLLAKIDSLRQALSFSTDENCHMKAQIAKTKLASLPPLYVPKRLSATARQTKSTPQVVKDEGVKKEEERGDGNRTDLEKSLVQRSSTLTEELRAVVANIRVVDITKKPAQVSGKQKTPHEILAQQVASVLELRQKTAKLREESQQLLAGAYPGGAVHSRLRHFVSPQFAKVVDEAAGGLPLLARLNLPSVNSSTRERRRIHLPAVQFEALHSAIVT